MNGFFPNMPLNEVNRISMLGLAHVGDGVYELLVRSMLCRKGFSSAAKLHFMTVNFVNARAQAKAMNIILPSLTEDERTIYKRGRNAKVNSVPHNADLGQYHTATGLESLFGWLYLQGNIERINQLFSLITEGDDDAS